MIVLAFWDWTGWPALVSIGTLALAGATAGLAYLTHKSLLDSRAHLALDKQAFEALSEQVAASRVAAQAASDQASSARAQATAAEAHVAELKTSNSFRAFWLGVWSGLVGVSLYSSVMLRRRTDRRKAR